MVGTREGEVQMLLGGVAAASSDKMEVVQGDG